MIGKIARDVRTSLHIKQEEFAYKLGISREYYSKIENGKVKPNAEMVLSIIDAIKHFVIARPTVDEKESLYTATYKLVQQLPISLRERLKQDLDNKQM
jgi:transcriptional regulator with XRE-family HTH domain